MSDVDRLRKRIISQFNAAYLLNDRAHQIEHFHEVESCGNAINNTLGLNYDPKLILYVAYFHDLFAWSRENHHRLSGEFIRGTCHPLIKKLSSSERIDVAIACEEHRASFKGRFTTQFSMLMNCADRGFPNDVPALLERAIQYRLGKGDTRVEALPTSVQHLKEKYGRNGYAVYPEMYTRAFGDVLDAQYDEIDAL